MSLHPQRERFQTAEHQKTVERSGNRADGVLQKPHPIAKFFVVSNDGNTADHVGVTVQIFGRRMYDDIETKFDRPLNPWRRSGVVGNRTTLAFAPTLPARSPFVYTQQ